jgi:uncharacterized membrane protein YhiD involved in acid resistance
MEDLVIVVSRLFAGGLIDLERAYTGRPAGLRTHFPGMYVFKSVDVTYSVSMGTVSKCAARHCASGSNTHGSRRDDRRWIFRAGVILGMGFYKKGLIASVLTLTILSFLCWLEKRIPSRVYYCPCQRLALSLK